MKHPLACSRTALSSSVLTVECPPPLAVTSPAGAAQPSAAASVDNILLRGLLLGVLLPLGAGCGTSPQTSPTPDSQGPAASDDWTRDIERMQLTLDVSTYKARASLQVKGSDSSTGVSFEAQGLTVESVTLMDGSPLQWEQAGEDHHLKVGLPLNETALIVDYVNP